MPVIYAPVGSEDVTFSSSVKRLLPLRVHNLFTETNMRLLLLPLLLFVASCDKDDDPVERNVVVHEDCRDNAGGPDCPDQKPQ